MSFENRLRAELRAEAGEASANWTDVLVTGERLGARRRAQRRRLAALSVAAVIALATLVFAVVPRDESRRVVGQPHGRSAYFVTAEDRQITLRSSVDGSVIKVIRGGFEANNAQYVDVSADGTQVFFMRESTKKHCRGSDMGRAEIVRTPLSGGPTERIAYGIAPIVSPDGRSLAYFEQYCNKPGRTVVLDPVRGSKRTIHDAGGVDRAGLRPLSWSPDGNKLLAEVLPPDAPPSGLVVVDVSGPHPQENYVGGPGFSAPAAFVTEREIAVAMKRGDEYAVVSVAPMRSLDDEKTLFTSPTRPAFLRADPSGRNILIALEADNGYDIRSWSKRDGFRDLGNARMRDFAWARR
jgi:hypothetical protein